ncbi:hypothetical protein AKJ16_DCAP19533 [Drosera capensis]
MDEFRTFFLRESLFIVRFAFLVEMTNTRSKAQEVEISTSSSKRKHGVKDQRKQLEPQRKKMEKEKMKRSSLDLQNRFIPFTREAISLIMGLRCYGLHINIDGKYKSDTLKFVFAGHENRATRNELCTRMFEFAKAEDEINSDNFMRIL